MTNPYAPAAEVDWDTVDFNERGPAVIPVGFRSPPRPEGVSLCRSVPGAPTSDGKPTWRTVRYGCRVVLAGTKDDVQIWRAVCDKWMREGDWLEVDVLPNGAVVTGPPGSTLTTAGMVRDA